ncbi:MAG: DUF115 domain-containing protein [Lachnospiraceae bacterium]|nr:DUF115 domain-containing protein [Lachnospiraceae bacterium]
MTESIRTENERAFYRRFGISLVEKDKSFANCAKGQLERRFEEAERILREAAPADRSKTLFAMVMGIGDGSFVRDLYKSLPKGAAILVWEPNWQVVTELSKRADISDLLEDPDFSLAVGPLEEAKSILEKELAKRVAMHNMYHAVLIPVPGFSDCYVKEAGDMIALFKKAIFELSTDVATRECFQQLNARCELFALSQLADNSVVEQLFDAKPSLDVPIVIVAAGPSLSKNAERLRDLKERALVIVVAHAAKKLVEMGIEPDLVAHADSEGGEKYTAFDKEGKLRFLVNAKSDIAIQEKYNGKLIYESVNLDLYTVPGIRKETSDFENGGSVATNLCGLFLTAGFKTIILVGQDLAYSEEGFSHTGEEREESSSDQMVTGIDGKPIRSRGDWIFFLRGFERLIPRYPDATVIDATEGGALIGGTKIMTLQDAIEKYCQKEYPITSWIEGLPKGTKEDRAAIERIAQKHKKDSAAAFELLKEAVTKNRIIADALRERKLGESRYSADCTRYDELYHVILTENDAPLLMEYCDDLLQLYVKEALSMESESDLSIKLDFEHSLFSKMQDRCEELLDYLGELFPV